MSGAIVATLLTMVLVPILYWELRRRESPAAPTPEISDEDADAGVQRLEPTADLVTA
jgi:hypothetical protein